MIINWDDETESVQGTPVNRKRLMGMQGFLAGNTTITKSGNLTTIVETSAEGTCTTKITRNTDGTTTIVETFVSSGNKTIRQTTSISQNGSTTTITDTTTG